MESSGASVGPLGGFVGKGVSRVGIDFEENGWGRVRASVGGRFGMSAKGMETGRDVWVRGRSRLTSWLRWTPFGGSWPGARSRGGERRRGRGRDLLACGGVVEGLEARALLTGVWGDPTFARIDGEIGFSRDRGAERAPMRLGRSDFDWNGAGRVLLRIDVEGLDGLDPRAARLTGGRLLHGTDNAGDGSRSVSIVETGPGARELLVSGTAVRGFAGASGAFRARIALAGDANGDFRVDRRDVALIRGALGGAAEEGGASERADVDGNGVVNTRDLSLAIRNLRALVRARALMLDATLDRDGESGVEGVTRGEAMIARGTTRPGARVEFAREGESSAIAATTADASGFFELAIPAEPGLNRGRLRASEPGGQRVDEVLAFARIGDGGGDPGAARIVSGMTDFRAGDADGWTAGFADLPADADLEIYELRSGMEALPGSLGAGSGFRVQGMNRSDDLFMFLTKALTAADGVAPNRRYLVEIDAELGSSAPSGAIGIGGAPGESVYVKAGASGREPRVEEDGEGWLRFTMDKGNQSEGGRELAVIGNAANGRSYPEDGSEPEHVAIRRSLTRRANLTATSDGEGRLWLTLGTDSGFEGLTNLYYLSIAYRLIPLP